MLEMDKGASLRDRATAVEPVPVSPLRDGIPSAENGVNIAAWSRNMITFIRERGLEQEFTDWCGGWPCPIESDETDTLTTPPTAQAASPTSAGGEGLRELLREAADCIDGEFGPIKLVRRIDAALASPSPDASADDARLLGEARARIRQLQASMNGSRPAPDKVAPAAVEGEELVEHLQLLADFSRDAKGDHRRGVHPNVAARAFDAAAAALRSDEAAVAEAVAAERERCAMVAEEIAATWHEKAQVYRRAGNNGPYLGQPTGWSIATAIRHKAGEQPALSDDGENSK